MLFLERSTGVRERNPGKKEMMAVLMRVVAYQKWRNRQPSLYILEVEPIELSSKLDVRGEKEWRVGR
jgi:hypothetical protein